MRRKLEVQREGRRINELYEAVKNQVPSNEVRDKVNKLKDAMENLGIEPDKVINLIADDEEKDKNIGEANKCYYAYDDRTNNVIKLAFKSEVEPEDNKKTTPNIRIQKLQVPKFDSSPISYYKWKLTFERYMKQFDDETKYDYLFSYTEGISHEYVMNKSNYKEAIAVLDEKFGNKHIILKRLLDEIKSLKDVDHRNVEGLVKWMQSQPHIRRLTQLAISGNSEDVHKKSTYNTAGTISERYRKWGETKLISNPIAGNTENVATCCICKGNHGELVNYIIPGGYQETLMNH